MKIRTLSVLLLVLSASFYAKAQEPPKTPAEPAATEPAQPGQFKEVYSQFKKLVARLRQLRDAYPTASPDEQKSMEEEFGTLMAQGRELAPKLKTSAEQAFRDAPNQEKEITSFMISAVREAIHTDDYDEAARLSKMLIDNKIQDDSLYGLAGLTAVVLNDFKTARPYLKRAGDADALDDRAKEALADLDNSEKAWNAEKKIRDAEAKADDLPRVKITTSKGDIVVELFENQAPNTVANFISLVEKKFYDGVVFHRVLGNFMAQGGDPTGTGSGGPGYHIACECYRDDYRKHFRGSLSMAHAGRDTGGSQFFLTFVPTTFLDGKHTVFGRVIEGFDVLSKIQRRDPESPNAPTPDKIVKATVVRKRDHAYVPNKVN